MPRRPRVVIEGGLYHVYNRFARGEPVFADPEEIIEFLELLRGVERRDGLTVLAWAVMSNHFHVALRTSAVPLARSMRYLQGRYSRAFNRRWKRSGPLWQDGWMMGATMGATCHKSNNVGSHSGRIAAPER